MGKTNNYLVPGYCMNQEDVDSLSYFVVNVPDFTEFDNMHIYPILRYKNGKRFNTNINK